MDNTLDDNWYWNSQRPRSWTDDYDGGDNGDDEDEMKSWASLARKALHRWMQENPY